MTKSDICAYDRVYLNVPGKNLALELLEGCDEDDNYVDCLLYTSPSPRDRQKSRMPSSA